jgi:hypothetical protein
MECDADRSVKGRIALCFTFPHYLWLKLTRSRTIQSKSLVLRAVFLALAMSLALHVLRSPAPAKFFQSLLHAVALPSERVLQIGDQRHPFELEHDRVNPGADVVIVFGNKRL